MPKIEKNLPKKVKKTKSKITKKTANSLVPIKSTKTLKVKSSPIDYYNCLLTSAQQGWYDPITGKKKQITACCKECKLNAPALNNQRSQELKKLITSYQQVGESLKRLLKPIK